MCFLLSQHACLCLIAVIQLSSLRYIACPPVNSHNTHDGHVLSTVKIGIQLTGPIFIELFKQEILFKHFLLSKREQDTSENCSYDIVIWLVTSFWLSQLFCAKLLSDDLCWSCVYYVVHTTQNLAYLFPVINWHHLYTLLWSLKTQYLLKYNDVVFKIHSENIHVQNIT